MKVILIKYGELTTKGDNKKDFINKLYKNIFNKLKDITYITKTRDRMFIEFEDDDFINIKNVLDKTFGIHSYHIAEVVNSVDEDIKNCMLKIIKNISFKTFKIETKRSNKNFLFNSQEYNQELGALVLKNKKDITVDVHNPDKKFIVEIRDKNTYIYYENYKGIGGYPVGVQPLGLLMLSGGIDSPVAGYLSLKRGMTINSIYFEARPHTSVNALNKVKELSKKLKEYDSNLLLYSVNFTKIQEAIYKNCRKDYLITIMRRMMYRIMDRLCDKLNAYLFINGESIGQVASQTLASLKVINNVTNKVIIRPCATLDKLEIMDIARQIKTYDISILPYEDCCTVFVPKHPVINPKLEIVLEEEKKIDYEKMIDEAIDSIKIVDLDNDYSSII